jgi:glycosyltransferase involved in cell wall biosynthesis
METPRIAIVHEWLTAMRGGEKCVEAMCELFPSADLYTLLHIKDSVSPSIEQRNITTSFVQHLPFSSRIYRYYLPLFPTAVQQFSLDQFDIVLSSHHCVAKGVHTQKHTLHICYCHTPMRYLWDLYDVYFREGGNVIVRAGARVFRGYLRRWDLRTAGNPHFFIANSENIRKKILSLYGREAEVIYPPVDVQTFRASGRDDGYFLVVGALVPYKRVDVAIEAFNATGQRLVVAGDGPDRDRLKRMAHPNIEFVGWQTDDQLRALYSGCRALVFPGEEDFGIVPVEAMASGKAVIALGKGGVLETVVNGVHGVLFRDQTRACLEQAVRAFEPARFNADELHRHAMKFDRKTFLSRFKEYVEQRWKEWGGSNRF